MTYTYPELCALFRLSPASNRMRKRLKLMTEQGFPPPLPGGGRWSKPAVDAWLHNWGSTLSSPAFRAGEAPQSQAIARDEGQAAQSLQHQLRQIYN